MVDAAVIAQDSLAALGRNGRYFVVPRWKTMFVSVAKNACTTLKWMMAEVAEEDLDSFRGGLHAFPSPAQAIHDRTQWKRALRMVDVPSEVRRTLHPDHGWFVFAVVRDPRARFFSAWEQKFLLNNPGYRRWRREPWYPRFPDSEATIAEDFARFVAMLDEQRDHELLRRDTHFMRQRRLLLANRIPYSRIYEISEMKTLRADLEGHLRAQGWTDELTLRRSNDTPLRATAAVLPPGVRATVESLYAPDFKDFGHLWDFGRIEATPAWTEAELEDIRVRRELGERLGEMRALGLQARKEADRLARQNARLRERLAAPAPTPEPLIRKVARRLRSAG